MCCGSGDARWSCSVGDEGDGSVSSRDDGGRSVLVEMVVKMVVVVKVNELVEFVVLVVEVVMNIVAMIRKGSNYRY